MASDARQKKKWNMSGIGSIGSPDPKPVKDATIVMVDPEFLGV